MVVLAGMAISSAAASAQDNPNIVLILADDLGYGDVGALNPDSKIPTPNIDRIAEEGISFTDAHSGSSVCTPTRYGILTGRYAWRSELKRGVLQALSPPLLKRERLTIGEMLQERGYHSAAFGKWHVGMGFVAEDPDRPQARIDYAAPLTDAPVHHGFDEYYGIPASLDMAPYFFVENDRVVSAPTERIKSSPIPAFYRGGGIAPGFDFEAVLPTDFRNTIDCIDRHATNAPETPLFVYLALPAPHTPIVPTEAFRGQSGIGPYGDFVMQVDDGVGRILDALERNGMADNTIVAFTSDNGFAPIVGPEALEAQGHDSNYHFRGYKFDIYEGGHRVPFFVRWPDRIEPGRRSDHLICLTDYMATFAEASGATLPPEAAVDSFSFLPALLDADAEPARDHVVHHSVNGSFALREGAWKLAFCPGSGGQSDPKPDVAREQGLPEVQLFDLDADIGETTNVQAENRERYERMTQRARSVSANGRSTPGPNQANDGGTPPLFRQEE